MGDGWQLNKQSNIYNKPKAMNQLIKTEKLKDRELIEIKDLIETLGVSQNTIYRMCDRNELQKLKFRGKCWFRTESILTYLNSKGILNNNDCIKI